MTRWTGPSEREHRRPRDQIDPTESRSRHGIGKTTRVDLEEIDGPTAEPGGPTRTPPPPAAPLDEWPARLDAAPDQEALDAVWGMAVRAVADAAAAGPTEQGLLVEIAHHGGERVWAFAHQRAEAEGDGRNVDHYQAVYRMRGVATAHMGSDQAVNHAMTRLETELDYAARGATTIQWDRQGGAVRRVLVAGFDPFASPGMAPAETDWNPSGSAVMQLDGQTLTVGNEVVAIEGVVYPVSFAQFDRGIVERVVSEQGGNVDAIITVSMDGTLQPGTPLQIERYAAGVRNADTLSPVPEVEEPMEAGLVRIPTSSGGQGPPIIDASQREGGPTTDLDGIAEASGAVVDTVLVFRFTEEDYPRAVTAFGTLATEWNDRQLRVIDPATNQDIARQLQSQPPDLANPTSPRMTFTVQDETFTAELTRGPAGAFLSNEVGYRTQRQLTALGSQATSFHVHTTNQATDLADLETALLRIISATIQERQTR